MNRPGADRLEEVKRRFGLNELLDLARLEGLLHRGSGRNRAECPGCRNGDARGASIGERDGIGVWNCHRDERHRGTAIDFLALSRSISVAEAIRELERLVGPLPATAPPPRARPTPSALRPPAPEVAALWNACRPITLEPDIAAEWAARGLDLSHVEDRKLARALPRGASVPRWAGFGGQGWSGGRHRLIVPMYDACGRLQSVHARAATAPKGVPKGLSPAGFAIAGLVMADPLARLLLSDEPLGDGEPATDAVRRYGLVICEGVPDFLTWATRWGDAAETASAVIGVISGGWTPEIAARVPDGTRVAVRQHADAGGEKYTATVAATLVRRCEVSVTVITEEADS